MKFALATIAWVALAVATVAASKGISGYCGQQFPRLFAASLCGHLRSIGGSTEGRSVGTFIRGSSASGQTGGLTAPTWSEYTTGQPRSWQHSDGHTYIVIEGVQIERLQNNWFTFEDFPAFNCSNTTCTRESSNKGPGGQILAVTFDLAGAKVRDHATGTGTVPGSWHIACVYAWVESGTLPVRLQSRIGASAPNQTMDSDITLTTTPTEYCVHGQNDGTAPDAGVFTQLFEDPAGDGTGVEFKVGYFSHLVSSVTTTPVKNHVATATNGSHTQREADVLPFSTADLSVQSGKGQVDVAWLDFAYDWPATPAIHTVVSLAKPGEVRDESGNGLNGTITGATYDGDGLLFDDDTEWVDVPAVTAMDDAGTLVAWVYPTPTAAGAEIYTGKTSGGQTLRSPQLMWMGATGQFRLWLGDGVALDTLVDSAGSLADNKWYMAVGTWDGAADDMDIYVYEEGVGLKVATTSAIGFIPSDGAGDDRIGRFNDAFPTAFEGTIAKVAGYSDTKDSAWVAAEFARGRKTPGCTTGSLELCYDMVPSDCRVYYDRPDASTNRFGYTCGGPTVTQTTTFARGKVTRFEWRHRTGTPLELCVDGACVNSAQNYVAPSVFDTNGCWGCDDPDGTPTKFLNAGIREARLR